MKLLILGNQRPKLLQTLLLADKKVVFLLAKIAIEIDSGRLSSTWLEKQNKNKKLLSDENTNTTYRKNILVVLVV